jgi:Arc/MetJ-type ribon-helix-helix transcriptional regulator
MKLLDLLNENELEKTTNEGPVDEIGKFFVVKKPAKGMTKENMVYEATGVYRNKSEANRHATEALKEYDMMMKEVEDAMNEFREAKKGIDEKKKLAKEKIQKLK